MRDLIFLQLKIQFFWDVTLCHWVCSYLCFLPNYSNCSPKDTALQPRQPESSNTIFLLDKCWKAQKETDNNCYDIEACDKILVLTPFQASQAQRTARGLKRTRYPARHHLGTHTTHQTPARPARLQPSSLHLRCFERPPTHSTVSSWCSNIHMLESDAPTTADETHTSLC